MKAIKEIKTEGGWIRGKACENGYAFLGDTLCGTACR